MDFPNTICCFCFRPVTKKRRRLSCNHICCKNCAKHNCVEKGLKEFVACGDPVKAQKQYDVCPVTCHVCGKETAFDDVAVAHKAVRSVAPQKCLGANCQELAVWKCTECTNVNVYCGKHKEIHDMIFIHKMVEIPKCVEKEVVGDVTECKTHGLPFKYLCKTCGGVRICMKCDGHGGHMLAELGAGKHAAALEKVKKELNMLVAEFERDIEPKKIDFAGAIAYTKERFEALHEELRKQEEAALKKIEQCKQEADKYVEMTANMRSFAGKQCKGQLDMLDRVGKIFPDEEAAKFIKKAEDFVLDMRHNKDVLENRRIGMRVSVGNVIDEPIFRITRECKFTKVVSVVPDTSFATANDIATELGTIRPDAFQSVAVLDNVRQNAFQFFFAENRGRDAFITRFRERGGMPKRQNDVIPFKMRSRPVFDGEKYIYCTESGGTQFGRINVENINSLQFELLPSAELVFSDMVFPYMQDGKVCAFERSQGFQMVFDVHTKQWTINGTFKCQADGDCQCVPHPWDNKKVVFVSSKQGVQELDALTGAVLKTYKYTVKTGKDLSPVLGTKEVVILRAPEGEFFLAVLNKIGLWNVFSSKSSSWTDAKWRATGISTSNAFFNENDMRMYYHVNGCKTWSAVDFSCSKH